MAGSSQLLLLLFNTVLFILCIPCYTSASAAAHISINISTSIYPSARRDETIVDDFHGTKVPDPYRWMEDPNSPETRQFVEKLNNISRPFFDAAPNREQIKNRLTELLNYERFTSPSKHGKFYYYTHNTGLQNQNVIYQQTSVYDKGDVFLDVNNMSADGTIAINGFSWTDDGSIMAYALSKQGSDWNTIKFRGANKEDLEDIIPGVRHSKLAWLHDNSGVFYSKYPDHKVCFQSHPKFYSNVYFWGIMEGTSVEKNDHHSLFFHRIGTDSAEDVLVYDREDLPGCFIVASSSQDGKYLIITVRSHASPHNMLYYYDLSDFKANIGKITPKPLFDKLDATYKWIDHDNDSMLILTNRNASMFKLIRISLVNGSTWDVVAEDKQRILSTAVPAANKYLILSYMKDVKHTLHIYDLFTGSLLHDVHDLPNEAGSINEINGKKTEQEVFFNFESFTIPKQFYLINFTTVEENGVPKIEEIRRTNVEGINEKDFMVEQIFYKSKDGTKVPMYIISSTNASRNGENPTVLAGYGGFDMPRMPSFSVADLVFVKYFKGIVAVANIRGGGEYGENWHKAGMRENKQNVFDDFISASEFLVQENYTNTKKLAITGASNGGLLVAVCAQQRPDLYGAVIGSVGVLDMLRFHKFTAGGYWVSEYGNPDNAEDFKFIYKYSPLHNIRYPKTGQWPSTLMLTSDHDDRVVPSHTLKYAATIYEMIKNHPEQTNPILFHIEEKAGHGAGKPLGKMIAEAVDKYSFLIRVLNLEWSNSEDDHTSI